MAFALLLSLALGLAAALPRAPLIPTSISPGSQVDAALGLGASRSWLFAAADPGDFTAQATMSAGDVSLTICNLQSSKCRTVDGSFASSTETLTVNSVADEVYGGAGAQYSLTATALAAKQNPPFVSAARFSLTLTVGSSALAPMPSPSAIAPWTEVYDSTTVAQGTSSGAAFFRFTALQATAIAFTATSTSGGELELSLSTVHPVGDGSAWAAFTSALSTGPSSPALIPAQPSDQFFMGNDRGSYYVLRVSSTSGAEVQFSLRAEYSAALQLPSPTPTPSPSAAPLSPASPLLPVEPLSLDAHPVRDSLRLGGVREWSYIATSETSFTVVADNSFSGGSGDVSLRVCGETDCVTQDSSYAGAKEIITVEPGSTLWGGLGASYSITVTALSSKQTTPQVANHIVYVSSLANGGGASPSPIAPPPSVDLFEVFLDTSIAETVGGVDPLVRFFQLRSWVASYSGGITVTLTVTGALPEDAEVSVGVAAPWGAGLTPTEWRPLLVAATSAGSPTAVLAVPVGSPAYMGIGQLATYYVRVRSATAAKTSFLLRIASDGTPVDNGIAASPTPTPSPSAAPLSPASPLLPVEPLSLDAHPVRDSLRLGGTRLWSYVATSETSFTVVADNSFSGGSGDVSLRVCGETDCVTQDSSYASAKELITVGPGSKLWGGLGASYSITVTALSSKQTTPQVANHIVYVSSLANGGGASPSPIAPPPSVDLFEVFLDTSIAETVGGVDPLVRFFQLRSWVASYSGGITVTLTVTGAVPVDAEVSVGVAAPWGAGLTPTEWRPLLVAATSAGSPTAVLAVPVGSPAYMGIGQLATYYVRVRSATAAKTSFLLRIASDGTPVDNGIAASPTPAPSPSAAPLSPASPLLPVEPLSLDAHPVRDSLRLGGVREWSYVATSETSFTVVADNSYSGGSGDVSLRVCGETACISQDSSYASAKELITVGPGSKLWGGLGASYSITVTALSSKQTTPQVANHIVYVSSLASGGGASPSPTSPPPSVDLFEVFLDTSIAETVGGVDPLVRFFQLRSWVASYSGGITVTLTVTGAVPEDAEVSVGVAAPWGAGLTPTEWRPLLVAATSAGSPTAVLAVPVGSPAYMGFAQLASYYVRVRSATAAKTSFLLRIASDGTPVDNGIAASPTPTPSPSAAPLSPASPLLPVEPLSLDAHPVRDSLGLGAVRLWSYIATSETSFTIVADNSYSGGSGDVSLRVCGETECYTQDSSYASAKEYITVGPGSNLWGGLGASYSITVTALSSKQTTPQVANHIVFVSSLPNGGGASPSPAPMAPATSSYRLFFDTSVAEVVGGAASGTSTARFFELRPGSYTPGFTVTLSIPGTVDAEVALGTAAPWGAGLTPTEWRPLLVAATSAGSGGSATATLGVPPGSSAYLGTGAGAAYFIRVRSTSADAAALAPFLLRAGTYPSPPTDFAAPATPTPTPSASPSPPGTLFVTPAQPLTLSQDFVDAVGVTARRTYSYQHASNTPFILYVRRGSGDPVLKVCGESDCQTSDSSFASTDEQVLVGPGSTLWGGIGASYSVEVYNSVTLITTPQVCNYVIGAYAPTVPGAPPTATPGPLAAPQQLFEGTEVGSLVDGSGEDWYAFSPPAAAAGPWAFAVTNNAASGTLTLDIGPVAPPGVGRAAWLSHSRAYASSSGGAASLSFGEGDAWYLPPRALQQQRTVYIRVVGVPGSSYKIQAVLTAPSATPSTTRSQSNTGTASRTQAPFVSPSASPTLSDSSTGTGSASATSTVTATPSPSVTEGATPSVTPTNTPSVSDTASSTRSTSSTPTSTCTPTATLTPGGSPSVTSSASLTASSTRSTSSTPSTTRSASATPSASRSPTGSPSTGTTPSDSPSPSRTPSSTLSLSATPSASSTATGSLSTGASPYATPSPSPTPSPSTTLTPPPSPSATLAAPLPSPAPTAERRPGGLGGAAPQASLPPDISGAVAAGVVVPLVVLAGVGLVWWRWVARKQGAQGAQRAQRAAPGEEDPQDVVHSNPLAGWEGGGGLPARRTEAWGPRPDSRHAAV